MILTSPIRTLIGPKTNIPSGVNVDRANAAIQRWYGEYSLPADVYAVPKTQTSNLWPDKISWMNSPISF